MGTVRTWTLVDRRDRYRNLETPFAVAFLSYTVTEWVTCPSIFQMPSIFLPIGAALACTGGLAFIYWNRIRLYNAARENKVIES